MEVNKKNLYIPVNVRRRKEIVSGFGQSEIMQTGIALVFGLIVGIIAYQIKSEVIYLVMTPLMISVVTAVFIMKDRTNTSFIDKINALLEFERSQKRYYYHYNNLYEKEVTDEKKRKRTRSENSNGK